jgi:hypothetical protein
MIIGVDFDNTIVCYDALFHRVALERGLIPGDFPVNKTAVRDHLRATGREDIWTEMQGEVYGPRLAEAAPYPGVIAFFRTCREQAIPVRIISHKTRYPYRGERHDLHAAARSWLEQHGFFDVAHSGLRRADVFFETSKEAKLGRISACGCTHFVDDLPELLAHADFPEGVERYLFDPEQLHAEVGAVHRSSSWKELQAELLKPEPWKAAAATLAGVTDSILLQALYGGANNRVFRLGETAVVKRYFQHVGDARDRFATEKAFYHYASAVGVRTIPRALAWSDEHRLGLFEYVEGRKPRKADARHLEAALNFFTALNAARKKAGAASLPLAAEACLSLDAHLGTIQHRIEGVAALPQEDTLDAEASQFVRTVLQPLWTETCEQVRNAFTSESLARELSREECCISPSDFGFHNAIDRADGTVVFLDFEYAGWDDPAKLIGDFFCQPDVPVDLEHFDCVISTVASVLNLSETGSFATRCRALLPIYQLKWSCILLNDFTAIGRSRRIFSLGAAEAAARRERQLARARHIIGPLLTTA